MKKLTCITALLVSGFSMLGCEKQPESVTQQKVASVSGFTVEKAQENLTFAKNQYLKMLDHIEHKRHLYLRPACAEDPTMICVPRSEEHGGIFMDKYEKWTNGFFPGALWKLLSTKQNIDWQEGQEQELVKAAKHFQKALYPDVTLDNTHDLGFMLYDSFGEALNYDKLDAETRKTYLELLDTGRATLATRYSDEKGVILSWDFIPNMKVSVVEDGKQVVQLHSIANPWTFPVIVDNMMNLEYLLDSDNPRYHEIAYNHAKNTSINHYFYDESDTKKQYPLSYHVFDYDSGKPGNWQGLGNISAWARGQGWSLYGFVTMVEYMEKAKIDLADYPDFNAHLQRVLGSIEHLLNDGKDGYVPYWDFFAARENAYEYAENTSPETTVYSGILELCAKRIEEHLKPYNGYRPMILDASILSEESKQKLQGKLNWYGEPILQGDKLVPCGREPYPETHQKIPRDSSAAALYAAALYRYINNIDDKAQQEKYAKLADNIMLELSNNYRTDRSKNGRPHSHEFGFVLAEATGDMGNAGELDTPIIYGDFYFIEANIRKIEYELNKK